MLLLAGKALPFILKVMPFAIVALVIVTLIIKWNNLTGENDALRTRNNQLTTSVALAHERERSAAQELRSARMAVAQRDQRYVELEQQAQGELARISRATRSPKAAPFLRRDMPADVLDIVCEHARGADSDTQRAATGDDACVSG